MGTFIDKITDKNGVEAEIKHSYLNASGNLEISNKDVPGAADDSKVNVVSNDSIQLKPGDGCNIQLDCEQNIQKGDPIEFEVRACNGGYDKSERTVGMKINAAEILIDNQKAHTTQVDNEDVFDIDKIRINFRTDKWKTGSGAAEAPTRVNHKGPADVKFRAKSFDIRCHGTEPGGGIALQSSGTDTDHYENKIKFESSRTTDIATTKDKPVSGDTKTSAQYTTEGGMGLEFGTFNNEHTSLFTSDYRFNKDGKVFAVTRETPVEEASGKIDYPTQSDDFKDVINPDLGVSWETIVKTAKVFENLALVADPKPQDIITAFNNVFHSNE